MNSKWAIAIFIAALMFLPQALAVTATFGGAVGSSTATLSSNVGTSINVNNALSQKSLSTSALGSISGTGSLDLYNEWVSWDFNEKAAAYAYLANSGSYTYNVVGTSGSKSATASLKISATDADDFLFGGFAYNPTNYAGTYVIGDWADTVTYKNSLSASSSAVKAGETFYGTGFTSLGAATWAEKNLIGDGSTSGEVIDEAGVLDMWNNFNPTATYYGFYGYANDPTTLVSTQVMTLSAGDISNSKKPYTASASASSTAATASQSVVLSDGASGVLTLMGDATTGDASYGYYGLTYLTASGLTAKPNNVVYSATTKSTLTQATATQTVDVKKADSVNKFSYAQSFDEAFVASESTSVQNGGTGIASSLKGSDTASASAASTTVSQKTTASGADINRYTYGFNGVELYYADSVIDVAHNTANKASTLAGSSTTVVNAKGSSVLSPTKWKAVIANGATATRTSVAFSDLGTISINTPAYGTYQWTDKTKATQTIVQSL